MGYIKISRGSRYKGFEYKVQSWDDLETLTNDAHEMMENILAEIRKVNHSSLGVAQSPDGLHNTQKTSKKTAVAQQQ